MSKILKLSALLALLGLSACATVPSGPGVLVLPGTGKSFDQFRADDFECRQFAQSQLGATPETASTDSGVRSGRRYRAGPRCPGRHGRRAIVRLQCAATL